MNSYIKAARLRTLPLSVSGIVVGSFLAYYYGAFRWDICVLALLTTIGFQVISNFANDYGDGVKGTDKNRQGEKRMIASGEITPRQMLRAIYISIFITLIISVVLIYRAFGSDNFGYAILFFFLGISSIIAAIKYTVGKNAYGYSGLGDVFVFLFFGLLSVLGSLFLYTKSLDYTTVFPASAIGLLSVAVLNLNNMRDRIHDAEAGKRTLVVINGIRFAKNYHYLLILLSLVLMLLYTFLHYKSVAQFLFLLVYIPLGKHLLFVANHKEPSQLDSQLKIVALSTFAISILFGIGLLC